MDAELRNWLNGLDVIEDVLAELISGVDLWVVLTLRDRGSGRPELADGGPVVLVWQSLVPKYVSPDDGAVWFDVGRDARPAVARWDADDGLSLHDSLPKECLAEMDGQVFCGETGLWGAQYLLRGGDEQKAAAHQRVADRLFCVEEEALLACASAPQGVLDTVGDLSLFGNWPTAIFYLAAKGVHPMLTAEGQLQLVGPPVTIWEESTDINPRPSRQSKDLGIAISADLLTATRYAFEALRQMADGGDAAESQLDTEATPKEVWDRFDTEATPPTFDGQPLEVGTGLKRNVLVKLVNARGVAVPYSELDPFGGNNTVASEQLRRAKGTLSNTVLTGLPVTIENHRGEGYSLKLKPE